MDVPATRLFLALVALSAACAERDRPLPFEDSAPVDLSVAVLSPRFNETVVAGRVLGIRVQASEPTGRLEGLGFVVRRSGETLDSTVVHFAGRTDSTHVFSVQVPGDLPTNAQLDIFGLAFGPMMARTVSQPRAIIVLRCTAGAVWCS